MRKGLFIVLLLVTCLLYGEEEQIFLAADQSLLTMPTAYTMPKMKSALTNYELIFNQYSFAISNNVHLTASMVFPFSEEVIKTFSVGTKARYVEYKNFNAAVWGFYNPHTKLINTGNTFSFGEINKSGHIGISMFKVLDQDITKYLVSFGGISPISSRSSLIGELQILPGTFIEYDDEFDENEDVSNLKILSLGIRFRGDRISWDLGAIRPLMDTDGLIALPFIKATFMF